MTETRKQAVCTNQGETDRFRIMRWDFAPGAETGDHVHEYDYVIVPGLDGNLNIVAPDGTVTLVPLKAGQSYHRAEGVHHNVINANDYDFWFVEVEIK